MSSELPVPHSPLTLCNLLFQVCIQSSVSLLSLLSLTLPVILALGASIPLTPFLPLLPSPLTSHPSIVCHNAVMQAEPGEGTRAVVHILHGMATR